MWSTSVVEEGELTVGIFSGEVSTCSTRLFGLSSMGTTTFHFSPRHLQHALSSPFTSQPIRSQQQQEGFSMDTFHTHAPDTPATHKQQTIWTLQPDHTQSSRTAAEQKAEKDAGELFSDRGTRKIVWGSGPEKKEDARLFTSAFGDFTEDTQ